MQKVDRADEKKRGEVGLEVAYDTISAVNHRRGEGWIQWWGVIVGKFERSDIWIAIISFFS